MIKPLEFHPQPNQPNHFYRTNRTKRTNNKVTTAPSTSFRGHLLYQLKTNLSSISMLTPPAHPSNNPPSLLYTNPNQLINPTQFCFSPHPKIFSANLIQVFFFVPLNDLPPTSSNNSYYSPTNPPPPPMSHTSSTLFLKDRNKQNVFHIFII